MLSLMRTRFDSIGSQADLAESRPREESAPPTSEPEKTATKPENDEHSSFSGSGGDNDRRLDYDSSSMQPQPDEDDAYSDEVNVSLSTQATEEPDRDDFYGHYWQKLVFASNVKR